MSWLTRRSLNKAVEIAHTAFTFLETKRLYCDFITTEFDNDNDNDNENNFIAM